jgi:hypothetical protein
MDIKLYHFSKKINSTKQPVQADSEVVYTCTLKEPCGILSPVIVLNMGTTIPPSAYNYAFIPLFGRYYYVKEWTYSGGLWTGSLEVDPLASWKSNIGASTCYILRSSVSSDGDILDMTYPCTGVTTLSKTTASSPWLLTPGSGMFVVGIAGQSTTYYLFTPGTLDTFFTNIFSDGYANAVTADWATVFPQLKSQMNPLQYVTSIMWVPFMAEGTAVTSVRVGWVDVLVDAYKVDGDGTRYGTLTFNTPDHPQIARGAYLNNSPYSGYNLFFPPWGKIQLDPDIVANSTTIAAWWYVDLRTGMGTLRLENETGVVLSWLHSQVGVNYQVSQVVNRGFGIGDLIAPAIGIGAGAMTGNVTGAITTTASAIGSFAASKIPSATTIGSNGGIDSLMGTPALQAEFKEIVSEDLDHRGRPYCQNATISTLGGYMMVSDADISLPATLEEQSSIRSYMEGGFFYE